MSRSGTGLWALLWVAPPACGGRFGGLGGEFCTGWLWAARRLAIRNLYINSSFRVSEPGLLFPSMLYEQKAPRYHEESAPIPRRESAPIPRVFPQKNGGFRRERLSWF